MIEDHRHFDSRARTVQWNQNLLPDQRIFKIVYLEGYMRNGLDRLGIRCISIKPHPLHTAWTRSKSCHVNVQMRHVNLVRTRDLRGNSNVVIAPAMPGNGRWRFVALS